MNSINTTDIAVASSPGADINGLTLIYMCSLFGFMKELLHEAGISTDNTMILDNVTIPQKERWMFSDGECYDYSWFTEHYSKCEGHSMEYVTDPKRLYRFTYCITTHFMTEMGDKSKCSDDSVRPDSDTNDTNTITLLSKDRLFYNFMVDTLDARKTCQARNDAVTISPYSCYQYFVYVRDYRAGSRCTYNTPSTDTDTELPYYSCLDYRLKKSLGADSACKDWTLISMCSLFGFMKELLHGAGISTDNTMILDNVTIAQKERWMFSDAGCDDYSFLTEYYSECEGHSMEYVTRPKWLLGFTRCITTHFMTEMGDKSKCSDDSVIPDSDTNDKTTITLLSKDRLFYNFMVDTLDARKTCQVRNDAVTIDPDTCDWYIVYVRDVHVGSRCTYNTPSTDTDTDVTYYICLDYRWMKSLGADSACKDWTLISMCSLFGFMKELLHEAGISTDNTMILDNDTIAQKERWMFSDAECDDYSLFTEYYSECEGHSMEYVTGPKWLYDFTFCITTHFMTEIGAKRKCSDDSVRNDRDTNDKTTITLLSKDRLFYNFMVDTLDARKTCQARNDAVTIDPGNCFLYISYMRTLHAGSRCTYNTPSTDTDTELAYYVCLEYRLLKSLGADSACGNRMTLAYMCSLFGLMREWSQEGVSRDSTMILDNDTGVQKKRWMFSDDDCGYYSSYAKRECVGKSMMYETDSDDLSGFIHCMTSHFMTEMGARSTCSDDSVRPDSDTNNKNTVTLLSKDRHFYAFMLDTLVAGNICPVTDVTVTVDGDQCDWYIKRIKYHYAESKCAARTDFGGKLSFRSYAMCLQYRLMKSLDADTVCQVSLFKSCFVYYDIVQSLIPTCICGIGLIGNLLSLWMFCSGAMNIPTAYQLQWLESVDITFIVTWWIVFVLPDTLYYFNAYSDHYRDWIQPVLYVCFRPLSYVARSCTVWLTVLIGLYRYLAICHPSNNLTFHVTRHGHKYVVLVVILSFLYNLPYFGEYYLHQEGFSRAYKRTSFVSKELLNVIYPSRVHSVIVVGVPCLILIFVTVSILVELRKREKKKRNMQTTQNTQNTQTTQNSVTPMFVTILITFILCQLPYFVWYGFGEVKIFSTYDYLDCGSVMFYIRWIINLGLLLNSSANGFIYFFLNKTFRDALSSRCPC